MTHDIAFLHTASVHTQAFQKLVEDLAPSIRVRHDVNESLLSEALHSGMTDQLCTEIDQSMKNAANSGAQVVMCTCSTIGGVAEKSLQSGSAVSMRIDRAMADLAIETSEHILILAAVESTLGPTKALLASSSANAKKAPTMTMELIQGAWPLFENGEMAEYNDCIERYIHANHTGYDCVVLAQASMASVASRFVGSRIRVLASPEIGVRSAIQSINPGP